MNLATGLILASASDYTPVAIIVIIALGVAGAVMAITHLLGPKRTGPVKDSIYESGVEPFMDARRRFNVRFYIVAMVFLLFDVEIVFFYPWATLFPRLNAAPGTPHAPWAADMIQNGFGTMFFFVEMLVFIAVLVVGYAYAWRKGVFRWD